MANKKVQKHLKSGRKSGEWQMDENDESNDGNTKKISKYVNSVKKEMKFFNYGLPPSPKYIDLEWDEVRKQFIALRELWVRLNVFEANGESQYGKIKYPEANRIIEYNLDGDSVNKSYIRFRSTRNHVIM